MGRGTKSSKDEGGDGVWGENAVVGGDSDSEGVDQGGNENEIVRRRKGWESQGGMRERRGMGTSEGEEER